MDIKQNKLREEASLWVRIFLGSIITAVGFVVFINPYHLVPGGVYGTSIILHGLFPSIQVGTFGYILQIPLLILAVLLIGRSLGARTICTVLFTPAIMNLLSWLAYPSQAALEALDPSQLFGGVINMSDHLILAAIFGGTIVGLGSGTILSGRAGTGGTDIVAMIINKYTGMRFSKAILLCDGCVVLCGFAFSGNIMLSLYSLIAIFLLAKSVNIGINGMSDDKVVYVICNEHVQELQQLINKELDLTATVMPCTGLYSGEGKQMLMMAVHNKSVPKIIGRIQDIAPECFLVVTDAASVYGSRWKDFPDKNQLTLD